MMPAPFIYGAVVEQGTVLSPGFQVVFRRPEVVELGVDATEWDGMVFDSPEEANGFALHLYMQELERIRLAGMGLFGSPSVVLWPTEETGAAS